MGDAVSGMYRPDIGDATIRWNAVPIRLSYAYDLYCMIDDLVPLLEVVIPDNFRSAAVYWGSSDFMAEWRIDSVDQGVRIDPQWDVVSGANESALIDSGSVIVAKEKFVAEWLKILGRIVLDIRRYSVSLSDGDILDRSASLLASR